MKAELIYLWINRDEHGCFQQEGFNFSPHYRVSYNQDTKELIIKQLVRIVIEVIYLHQARVVPDLNMITISQNRNTRI